MPIPAPPPDGELRRVNMRYRCPSCGTEIRMTKTDIVDPIAPRHCMDEMDLVAVDCSAAAGLSEGDWVTLDYALPEAAVASGLSQYELLTGLSQRLERTWA